MAYLGRPGATAPLTSADIPDNSITAAKIVTDTIAAGDLAPNSVDSSELVDGSIDTSHIGANQVTAAKVAADVATQAELDTVSTVASAALPKAGGTMTGNIVMGDDTSIGISDSDERIEFDGAGDISVLGANVGIGETAPAYKFHVKTSDGGTQPSWDTADRNLGLFETGENEGAVTIFSPNTGVNMYYAFADPESRLGGAVKYNHSSNAMYFLTDATARMVISGDTVTGHASFYVENGYEFGNTTYGPIRTYRTGTSSATQQTFQNANGPVGSISTSGSSTAFNTSSDYRLKENVIAMLDSIDRLKLLKPSRFNFISDTDITLDGFLAHEVQTVVPEAITGEKDAIRMEEYIITPAVEEVKDGDGNVTTEAVQAVIGEREGIDAQGMDNSKLVPLLVGALQEAVARIEALESA